MRFSVYSISCILAPWITAFLVQKRLGLSRVLSIGSGILSVDQLTLQGSLPQRYTVGRLSVLVGLRGVFSNPSCQDSAVREAKDLSRSEYARFGVRLALPACDFKWSVKSSASGGFCAMEDKTEKRDAFFWKCDVLDGHPVRVLKTLFVGITFESYQNGHPLTLIFFGSLETLLRTTLRGRHDRRLQVPGKDLNV